MEDKLVVFNVLFIFHVCCSARHFYTKTANRWAPNLAGTRTQEALLVVAAPAVNLNNQRQIFFFLPDI